MPIFIGFLSASLRLCRLTPESGHSPTRSECPLWAKNGLMQCSKVASYLIALAAVADILRHGTRSSWSTRL